MPLIRKRPLVILGRVRGRVQSELRAILELEGPQAFVHVDDPSLARLLSDPELSDLGRVLQRPVAVPHASKLGVILLVERDVVVPRDHDFDLRIGGLEHVHHALVLLFPANLGDVTGVQEHVGLGERVSIRIGGVVRRARGACVSVGDHADTGLDARLDAFRIHYFCKVRCEGADGCCFFVVICLDDLANDRGPVLAYSTTCIDVLLSKALIKMGMLFAFAN